MRVNSPALAERCARLRRVPTHTDEIRGTTIALRAVARRIRYLNAEIKELNAELEPRVRTFAPALLDESGFGPVNAAEIVCAWSHPGRVRSEAAFAALAGSLLTAMVTRYAAHRNVSPGRAEAKRRSRGAA